MQGCSALGAGLTVQLRRAQADTEVDASLAVVTAQAVQLVLLFRRPVFLPATSEIGIALRGIDVKIIAMLNEKVCIALPRIPTPGSAKKAFNHTQDRKSTHLNSSH